MTCPPRSERDPCALKELLSVMGFLLRFNSSNVSIALSSAMTTAFISLIFVNLLLPVSHISTVFLDSHYSLCNAPINVSHVGHCVTLAHSFNGNGFQFMARVKPDSSTRHELAPVAQSLFSECLVPNAGAMSLLAECDTGELVGLHSKGTKYA